MRRSKAYCVPADLLVKLFQDQAQMFDSNIPFSSKVREVQYIKNQNSFFFIIDDNSFDPIPEGTLLPIILTKKQ